MTKLVDVVNLLRRRLNPRLEITGFLPCLYDFRTKLAREVVAELRSYFPGKVFSRPVAKNVKLAEAPSYGKTIFEYAPESSGASDYEQVAVEVLAMEAERDPELAARKREAIVEVAPVTKRRPPPPRKRAAASDDEAAPTEPPVAASATRTVEAPKLDAAPKLETPPKHDVPAQREPALAIVELTPKAPPVALEELPELPELPPDAELLESATDD